MNFTETDEHAVLEAAFAFIDEWSPEDATGAERIAGHRAASPRDSSSSSTPSSVSSVTSPSATPRHGTTGPKTALKRPRSRRGRDLQKLELLRLREEVPVLENLLGRLRATRARDDAVNNDACRVIALAASELQGGSSCAVQMQLLAVWKDMAAKHQQLRVDAEVENWKLRELMAHQLRTIEALKKLFCKQTIVERSSLLSRPSAAALVFPRTNEIRTAAALNILDQLSRTLAHQHSGTDRVFRLHEMPVTGTPFSQTRSRKLSSSRMHIEVLSRKILPFSFRSVSRAFWRDCQKHLGIDPHEPEDLLKSSFLVNNEGGGLPFIMHGHSAIRKYEGGKRDVIVFSSMNSLVKMFAKDVSGVQYFEKGWLVFAPTSDDVAAVCVVQLCAGVTLDMDVRLPNRKRCVKLLTELLIEQKRQELDALRLGIEDLLLTSAVS